MPIFFMLAPILVPKTSIWFCTVNGLFFALSPFNPGHTVQKCARCPCKTQLTFWAHNRGRFSFIQVSRADTCPYIYCQLPFVRAPRVLYGLTWIVRKVIFEVPVHI